MSEVERRHTDEEKKKRSFAPGLGTVQSGRWLTLA
jgi:hypothetical protein